MTLPIKPEGGIDWLRVYQDAERDAFARAKGFMHSARLLDPAKYPNERHYAEYFIKEARRYNQCGVWHRRKAREFANV